MNDKPERARGITTPPALSLTAQVFSDFRILSTLTEKGVLTREESADTMVKIAHDIRSMTEDGPIAKLGETLAGRYEVAAGWLLGLSPEL